MVKYWQENKAKQEKNAWKSYKWLHTVLCYSQNNGQHYMSVFSSALLITCCTYWKHIKVKKGRYLSFRYQTWLSRDELFKDFSFKIKLCFSVIASKGAMLGPWQFMNSKQSVITFQHLYCFLAVHKVKLCVTSINTYNPHVHTDK